MKKNLILIIATIVLGAVAIFTGIKIYQLREEPVAPTQPKGVAEQCRLVLDIPAPTSTPTATPTPTPTLTPTPTPTPIPECWQICVNDDNCPQDLACQAVNEEKRCVNTRMPRRKKLPVPRPNRHSHSNSNTHSYLYPPYCYPSTHHCSPSNRHSPANPRSLSPSSYRHSHTANRITRGR